jgi:hypothetical protein
MMPRSFDSANEFIQKNSETNNEKKSRSDITS